MKYAVSPGGRWKSKATGWVNALASTTAVSNVKYELPYS
jgi:hypothetical protein